MSGRVTGLDGLRGWAALTVAVSHVLPHVSPFVLPPFTILTDSRLAVAVFFVISGFVLTLSFIKKPLSLPALGKLVVARYVRLALPVAAVTFIVLIFGFQLSLFWNTEADRVSPIWGYGEFYRFHASTWDAARFTLHDVFFRYDDRHTYIPPAWTMAMELLGSYFVYSIAYVAGVYHFWGKRNLLIGIGAVVALGLLAYRFHYFAYFLYGYVLASLYTHRREVAWREKAALIAFAGVVIVSALRPSDRGSMMLLLLSTLMVWSVISSDVLQRFFSNRVSAFLGRVSFTLYLIHVPIYSTFSSWLIVWLSERGLTLLQIHSIVAAVSLPLVILVAYLLYPVEALAISWSRRISRYARPTKRRPLAHEERATALS